MDKIFKHNVESQKQSNLATAAFLLPLKRKSESDNSGPLSIWTDYVARLTGITVKEDIAAPYDVLMHHLDTF